MMKRVVGCSLVLAMTCGAFSAFADDFAAGSLIVPMDTSYQDAGMLRAYGLVYELLRNGVPVRWIILKGKAFQQADFTASAKDHRTGAAITSHGYRGGPFVIDASDATTALPIIDAWQSKNPNVAVHAATTGFTSDVAHYLIVAPRIAMHADGNQAIARGYLEAAGIPDSTLDPTWPNTSPDMLTPAQVAGPSTSNHHDGALFDADGDPLYCQFMSMHWGVTEAQASPETVAEVRAFLGNPVHFYAECQAVDAFENLVPYGHFLTPNGFLIKSQPSSVDYYNADQTFAQIDGSFGTTGGSEPAYALPLGDQYKAGNITMITNHNSPAGTWDVWMTGFLDGACPPWEEVCGTLGKVSYLGGHQYSTNLPISTNPKTQGVRLFLNSLFDSTCASTTGFPTLYFNKMAPATTTSNQVTYSLWYANGGPTVALSAAISDPIPPGSTFVSATNGGTFSGGTVTWKLGNLGVGESAIVAVTVNLGSHGAYQNTAKLNYKVGLNTFAMDSNTTSTLYDNDTDGDGVLDSVDDCPNNFDPTQDLSNDVTNCGACGNACAAQNGQVSCANGACSIAVCYGGFSDCDGQYADGCEYSDAGFATDPKNCGGCGTVCSYPNAPGVCSQGLCSMGACSPGHSNCDGNAANGCEYDNQGFASDSNNCGGCGNKCAAGFVCSAASCIQNTCPAGYSNCDGNAANGCEYNNLGFQTDPSDCGGCNIKCAPANATGACSGGTCGIASCNAGHSDCNQSPADGCEYDDVGFATDPNNCGGCGNACPAANAAGSCESGMCGIGACNPGYSNCDGNAANGCEYQNTSFTDDPQNCGGCKVVCSFPNASATCSQSQCTMTKCSAGFVDLDQSAANGCEYACTTIAANDVTCDGVDDDCDGVTDEDYVPGSCGVGACVTASKCISGVEACYPGAAGVEGPAGSPGCSDGIDNDCNGTTDAADPNCQSPGCVSAADCNDGNPCTLDECASGFCSHSGIDCSGVSSSAGAAAGGAGGAPSGASNTSGVGGGAAAGGGLSNGASTAGTGTSTSSAGTGGSSNGTGTSSAGGGSASTSAIAASTSAAGGGTTVSSGAGTSGSAGGTGGGTPEGMGSAGTEGSNSPGDAGSCACRLAETESDSRLGLTLVGLMAAAMLRRSRGSRVSVESGAGES